MGQRERMDQDRGGGVRRLSKKQIRTLAEHAAHADRVRVRCVQYATQGLVEAFPRYDWPKLVTDHADFPYWNEEELRKAMTW
jgi:hypothetical protein